MDVDAADTMIVGRGAATLIVTLCVVEPPGPAQVTVYVVVVVSAPVSKEPVVPVPPPAAQTQEVLSVEDQETVVLAP